MSRQDKPKMTKDTVPEGFTMKMALVDALPVLFFGASMVVLSILFSDVLFLIGALLCLLAGAAKVLWKVIVVRRKKNIWWLFLQMRILMPIGFALMLLSVLIHAKSIDFARVWHAVTAFPPVICFAAGLIGMVLMGIFFVKLDSSDARSNWIEQVTNGLAQMAIFVGLLMLL
ncbi:MAG: hypothetical protein KBS74_07830 [Clostridiales bacterium]|nr:hypothetical protein [Candidatus Cacconaster stercorequi]